MSARVRAIEGGVRPWELAEGWIYTGSRRALIEAGHVPAGMPFPGDPEAAAHRRGVRFVDEDGRRRVISKCDRVSAEQLYRVRVCWRKDERAAKVAGWHARVGAEIEQRSRDFATRQSLSALAALEGTTREQARGRLLLAALLSCEALRGLAGGGFEGGALRLDDGACDTIGEHVAGILATFESASIRFDPSVYTEARRALARMDAEQDDDFQALLRQVGAR